MEGTQNIKIRIQIREMKLFFYEMEDLKYKNAVTTEASRLPALLCFRGQRSS